MINLPQSRPRNLSLARVLELMGRVIDEGRNAVRGLRSPDARSENLEQAFSGLQQELGLARRTVVFVFSSKAKRGFSARSCGDDGVSHRSRGGDQRISSLARK